MATECEVCGEERECSESTLVFGIPPITKITIGMVCDLCSHCELCGLKIVHKRNGFGEIIETGCTCPPDTWST